MEEDIEEGSKDQEESELIQELEEDEEINEHLFQRYDAMFSTFNQFGNMFQETAHYIGMLIKKNMNLHFELEQRDDKLEELGK